MPGQRGNPVDIIGPIGNPHKTFSDTDAAELRIKLRDLLYPEFKSTTP
jgi:rRNA processing protein Gar1